MTQLTEERARRIAAHLERTRAELRQSMETIRRQGLGEAQSVSTGELSSYDQHPADAGSETFERSKDLALAERLRLHLQDVEAALDRLQRGEYGRCQRCGRPIEAKRLDAVPEARYCMTCQEHHDAAEATRLAAREGGRRPLEEAALVPPFGRAFDPALAAAGLQAEDAWQAVARYGTANTPQDVPGAVDYDEVWAGADADNAGQASEVEAVADVTGKGVVDPERVYPDPAGPGRRRPREGAEEPDVVE